MSTDGKATADGSAQQVETEGSPTYEVDTPVERLKGRLSAVPEVKAKHGLPKPKTKKRSNPSVVDTPTEVSELPNVDLTAALDVKIDELNKARSDIDLAMWTTKQFGHQVDPNHQDEYSKLMLQFEDDKKVTDPTAAVGALDITLKSLLDLHRTLKSRLDFMAKEKTTRTAIDELNKAVVAPKYDGKNFLKETGEKEFRSFVAKPVIEFLDEIKPQLEPGKVISEDQHSRLIDLKKVAAEYQERYAQKQESFEKKKGDTEVIKHPHEHKLYKGYVEKCKTIEQQLKSIEFTNVDKDLTDYREKKREADVCFSRFEKMRDLWKRLDQETYEAQGKKQLNFRRNYDGIVSTIKDTSSADDLKNAVERLDDLVNDIKKATTEMFSSTDDCNKLDRAVADMGSKAKSNADVEFVKEAFKARFNVDVFEGELSKTNIVAFYNTFKMVPDSHTKANQWLTIVNRKKSLSDVESFYSADEKGSSVRPSGEVAIRAMRTSGPVQMVQNNLVAPMIFGNLEGNKKIDQFTWVTLHEIGHAVDHSDDFMGDSANNKIFGDWKKHSRNDIEALVKKEFRKEFPECPGKFTDLYLSAVLKGDKLDDQETRKNLAAAWQSDLNIAKAAPANQEDLLVDPGLLAAEKSRLKLEQDGWNEMAATQAYDEAKQSIKILARDVANLVLDEVLKNKTPLAKAVSDIYDAFPDNVDPQSEPDWSKLKKAKILKWYKSACLVEPKGVFDGIQQMTGAACWIRSAEYPIDGRIYHESYKEKWVSYDATARANLLTDYQFRAPGEFFAETYAAYFMKKLPKGEIYEKLKELKKKPALKN